MQRYDSKFLYRDYQNKAPTQDGILARMNERLAKAKENQNRKGGRWEVAQMRKCQ